MKFKVIFVIVCMVFLLVGCINSGDIVCNYDGVCDDVETDNCPDCKDVLGRCVVIQPSSQLDDEK